MTKDKNKHINTMALMVPEIRELLSSKNYQELNRLFRGIPAVDMAEGWKAFQPHEKILVFKLLSTKKSIEVFESLKADEQNYLLNNLDHPDASEILNEMEPDVRAKFFKELTPKATKKLFTMMKKEEVDDVQSLLTYKEDTAGSIMTTDFVEIKKELTARAALLKIHDELKAEHPSDIYTLYVTDENHKIIGGAALQDILKAGPDIPIKDIMHRVDYMKIDPYMNQEDVAQIFKKYDLLDAPVVDPQGRLIGIITVDDIVDVIDEETTKDLYSVGKMDPASGQLISYAKARVGDLLKRRAGWLMFLLVFDFLTGTVLKTFEHALSSVVALAFFIPMLLDTGGNAGNQTAITLIRGMATGDVTDKNTWRVIRLELATALCMGIIVGAVAFIRAILLQQELILGVVVGTTMFTITLLAIATGVFLPLFSKKIGLDPAVLAGPITTSIVDVTGLIIYFKIAQMLLPILR